MLIKGLVHQHFIQIAKIYSFKGDYLRLTFLLIYTKVQSVTGETILAPKEQPPRKLSGKRTVTVITLESRLRPHRRIKSLRYIDRWG